MDIKNFTTWEDYYRDRTQQLEKEKAELLVALEDLHANVTGEPKSCGHSFCCVCAGDKARALIEKHRGQQ